MGHFINSFFRRIATLRGTHNLAVQPRTILAVAFRAPLASNRAVLAAVLMDMPLAGTLHPKILNFKKAPL